MHGGGSLRINRWLKWLAHLWCRDEIRAPVFKRLVLRVSVSWDAERLDVVLLFFWFGEPVGSTGGEVSHPLTQPGFPREGGQQRPSATGLRRGKGELRLNKTGWKCRAQEHEAMMKEC